jgi:hypothetical protein
MSLELAVQKMLREVEVERPQKWTPDIKDVLEFVDLSIAFSPVLPPDCEMPCRVSECEDGTFIVYDYAESPWNRTKNDGRHTWGVSRETIKQWRARFLVTRDEIWRTVICGDYSNFPNLGRHSVKCQVLPAFGIHWVPGDDLRAMLAKQYGMRHADGSIEAETVVA